MSKQRLMSLDVLRGLTVIGMVLVNSAAVGAGVFPAFPVLLHANWVGLTLADFVFPAFILMVGASIPFALSSAKSEGLTGELALRLFKRGALLFAIGLLLTMSFVGLPDDLRIMGVLQRIGIVFVLAALLFIKLSPRRIAATAAGILLAYWGLCLLPVPDAGPANLHTPGQDFSSYLDRVILGAHVYANTAPLPYDPEGLMGTLPTLAQALIGVLAGLYVKTGGTDARRVARLAVAGVALLALGVVWSIAFPIVKSIWSSSFVAVTSGATLIVFALLLWALDMKSWRPAIIAFPHAFGINAITAYVLHTYLMGPVLASGAASALYDLGTTMLPDRAASLLPYALVIVLTWVPVAVMRRQGWILKV